MKQILLYFSLLFLSSTGFALNVPDMMDELIKLFGNDMRLKDDSILEIRVNDKKSSPVIYVSFCDNNTESYDIENAMRHYHNTGKKLVFDKIMIGSHVIDEKKLRRLINKIKNNYELTSAEAEEIVKNYLRKGSLGIGAILNEEVVKGWMYLAKIEPLGDFFGADAVMSEKEAACIIYAHVIARRVLEKTIERIESLE